MSCKFLILPDLTKYMKVIAGILFAVLISFSIPSALAHPHSGFLLTNHHNHQENTEIIPLDAMIGIEKSTILFHAPENNRLPWGFVEGKIANPVQDYPVIIKIYQDGDPAHFAQASVDDDGSYEYKFRVRSVDDGSVTRAFTGDYTVVIYKVVYLHPNLDAV